jgi:hypothetical protein
VLEFTGASTFGGRISALVRERKGTHRTGPVVIAEGRRVAKGLERVTARMRGREERASKESDDEGEDRNGLKSR